MACFPMKYKWIGAMLSGPSALLFSLDLIASSTSLVETSTSFSFNCLILRTIAFFSFLFLFGCGVNCRLNLLQIFCVL